MNEYNMFIFRQVDKIDVGGEIHKLRHMIRSNGTARFKGSLVMSNYWFENMTQYIDAMLRLQVRDCTYIIIHHKGGRPISID